MARHLIQPADMPAWGEYAFGRVGLPDGAPLQLRVLSVADPYSVEDLEILSLGSVGGEEGGLPEVISYLVAIYNAMTSMFQE